MIMIPLQPGHWVAAVLAILVSVAFVTIKSVGFVSEIETHSAHGRKEGERKEVLVVIAHPDDESMFFLPTILSLQDAVNFHLLCLSTGDFDGLGATRKVELANVWTFLGMEAANLTVLDDPRFKDGMKAIWRQQDVASVVADYAAKKKIDTIITFDDYGVSGHPNHISVHKGVVHAFEESSTEEFAIMRNVRGYVLDSTPLWRKYIGILDVFFTTPSNSALISLAPWLNYRAMALHHSQFVWFRRLFVVFSRYTFINTLSPIPTRASHEDSKSK